MIPAPATHAANKPTGANIATAAAMPTHPSDAKRVERLRCRQAEIAGRSPVRPGLRSHVERSATDAEDEREHPYLQATGRTTLGSWSTSQGVQRSTTQWRWIDSQAAHHSNPLGGTMAAHRSSRLAEMHTRITRVWSELGYANRRMFDIRTGEHLIAARRKADSRGRMKRRATFPVH